VVSQINTSVGQLDRMTQQSASLVQQSAAAADSLKEQASKLSQVIGSSVWRRRTRCLRAQAQHPQRQRSRPRQKRPPRRPPTSGKVSEPDPQWTTMDMITEARLVAKHEAARAARLAHAGEYLTFRLGAEECGIDILKVQEIRSYEAPTRIANAPAFVKRIVNLRGVIVPIVDLRLNLGCETAEYNAFTVGIVLNVRGRVVGAVVDSVSDVLELAHDHIKAAPELHTGVDARFITGIGAIGDRMLILIEIESLMNSAEMGLVGAAVA
jgi:purine-binding chemotaxis protein CheW